MALSFASIATRILWSALKAQLVALNQANENPVTSWITGDPTERWLDITPRLVAAVISDPLTQMVRGMFLDLATDPGDVAADGTPDMSEDQTPRPGFLSALGLSWYGTRRRERTYATLFVTVRNDSAAPGTFKPYDLAFTTTDSPKPNGGRPTYRNTADGGVYTGIGGTLTLAPGASATFPLIAEQIGSYGSAGANSMVCTTQTFGALTVTASTIAIGTERESAPLYRARCRTAADAHSPGGPGNAYRRAMNTAKDGSPLQRYTGDGPVTITDAWISPSSTTGVVTMYVAGPGGAVDSVDVSSATLNISGLVQGVITDPIGVLPDTVSLGPTTNDPNIIPANTPGCKSVINTTIAVTYSAEIKAKDVPGGASPGTYTIGGSPPANIAAIFVAIGASLDEEILSAGPGGKDGDVTGAGVIYTEDLRVAVKTGYPKLYRPVVSLPAATTTVINTGHMAVPGTYTGALVVI